VKGNNVRQSLFELQPAPSIRGIAGRSSSLQRTCIHSIMYVACTVQIGELAKPVGPAWAAALADAE